MADFDLTQTDQQVQNILNDAQGAMGASAQTTLTTEYVMLKDTNGVYHKILKSSFTEAIRDVLAGLLVNNDKGTTINQIAAIASGDFGSITPANLASVLGAAKVFPIGNYNIDTSAISEGVAAGVFCIKLLNANANGTFPTGFLSKNGSISIQIAWNQNVEYQFLLENYDGQIYTRRKASSGWDDWYKMQTTQL